MDDIMRSFQDEEPREEEQALSLCDFPLNYDEPDKKDFPTTHRSSDFFEFFNDLSSDNIMSHAEDIISCGKLIPYKQPSLFYHQILKSDSGHDENATNLSLRYCESLPNLRTTRSTTTKLTRSSRSLDCKKLRRNSTSLVMKSEDSDIQRSSSKGTVKSDRFKGWKPSWYTMMVGPVKFPQEMDLRDMKNRQVRRNTGSMFLKEMTGDKSPGNRSDGRSSWGHDLLKILSCKNGATVTASVGSSATIMRISQTYSRDGHVKILQEF